MRVGGGNRTAGRVPLNYLNRSLLKTKGTTSIQFVMATRKNLSSHDK